MAPDQKSYKIAPNTRCADLISHGCQWPSLNPQIIDQSISFLFFHYSSMTAVRADRMRGGRNKFGPMYKRDRARKLQIMRQRQLAVQALRAVEGNPSQLSPTGYQQPYSNMSIKQEIQIPQVSFNGTL